MDVWGRELGALASRLRRRRSVVAGVVCAVAVGAPLAFAAPAAGPTLTLTPKTLDYGQGGIVLSGVIPSKTAGEQVSILSQPCRFTEPAEVAAVTSKAGGAFQFRVQPLLNTSFRVRWNESLSGVVRVGVRPLVELRRLARGRYRARVSTTNPVFLDGKTIELQRKVGARWVTVKRAKLAKASPETAITVVSAVTITSRVAGPLRAKLPAAQASCYLGTASSPIAA